MNNQTIYWLWIQQAIGYASHKLARIAERYTFAEDFYRAPLEEKLCVKGFGEVFRARLEDTLLDNAAAIIKRCRESGIDIVSYGDEQYPERLRAISAPPAVLFVKGSPEALSAEFSIAIVGTRSASTKGRETAYRIASEFAKQDVCVVSGGARGIDTQAHLGALHGGGETVCVLGCGHECGYMKEYDYLKETIARRGAVISEYPPDYRPSRLTFPQRNRIISGLSKGVLVIEAGQRSGSLITVDAALEQGRDVFAVPGDVSNPGSIGTNALIKDGAKPVTSAGDVLSEYLGVSEQPEPAKAGADQLSLFDFSAYIDSMLPKEDAPDEVVARPAISRAAKKQAAAVTAKAVGAADKPKKKSPEKPKKPKKTEKTAETKHVQRQETSTPPSLLDDISDNAAKFLSALGGGELHIDEIADKAGLSVGAVHAAATELEMNDIIEALPGRRYKIKQ